MGRWSSLGPGGAEARFKGLVRQLHARGRYPTPTLLNEALHGRRCDNINGQESRWRREVMAELGVPLMRKPNPATVSARDTRARDHQLWKAGLE